MDLRTLRYFQAVAEEQHFGRAATRLHMAQPPLSRQIKLLEDELGVPLFVRTPKGVELTEAGQTLLEEARNLLELAHRAKARTQASGQGLTGRLDVGLFGSGVLDAIPRMLARFHEARPKVKIVLHNMTKSEQLSALRERRIAVGFSRLVPEEPGITVETVLREPLMVALPQQHRLAKRAVLRITDMEDERLIHYPNVAMRGLGEEVAEAFKREGVRYTVEQDVEDVLTAVALAASGFGIVITTQSATSLRLPGIVYRPLSSQYLKYVELDCAYRSGDASPVLASLLEVVRAFAREQPALPKPALAATPGRTRARRRGGE